MLHLKETGGIKELPYFAGGFFAAIDPGFRMKGVYSKELDISGLANCD
ncbi:unnamed protein product, partial [marine sediment metagenome]